MSEATHHITPSCKQPPFTLEVSDTGTGGDAELIALAAEFERLQREIDPLLARFFSLPAGHPELIALAAAEVRLVGLQGELVIRARDIVVETVVGLRAKAAIARGLYRRQRADEIEQGLLNEEEDFALGLINSVIDLKGASQ